MVCSARRCRLQLARSPAAGQDAVVVVTGRVVEVVVVVLAGKVVLVVGKVVVTVVVVTVVVGTVVVVVGEVVVVVGTVVVVDAVVDGTVSGVALGVPQADATIATSTTASRPLAAPARLFVERGRGQLAPPCLATGPSSRESRPNCALPPRAAVLSSLAVARGPADHLAAHRQGHRRALFGQSCRL